MYYIEFENNVIVSKGQISKNIELLQNQKEITEEEYNSIQLPSTFENNVKENIINIVPIIKEPVIVDEQINEEQIAMAEAIIDLDMRLQKLEGGTV